jgi:hypothetical protein
MSWSLALRNGDLAIGGPGSLLTVSGQSKLAQDMKCWLLEPIGTDPIHTDFGSSLDGGDADGVSFETLIGGTFDKQTILDIESEIRRVLTNYQRAQLFRLQDDKFRYNGQTTLESGEVLYRIDSVESRQSGDKLVVFVNITTAAGARIPLTIPIGT